MRLPIMTILLTAIPVLVSAQQNDVLADAGFEDYRTAAGRVEDGTLRLTLTAGVAAWRPWGTDGPVV